MPQIQGLEFIITNDITGAVQNIDMLSGALRNFKAAVKGGIGLTTVGKQLKEFDEVLKKIDLSKFAQFTAALSQVGSVSPKLSKSFVTNMAGLGAALQNVSEADVSKLERIGQALSHFPSQLSLTGLGSIGKAVAKGMPTEGYTVTNAQDPTTVEQTGSAMGSLTAAMQRFGAVITPVLGRFGMLMLSFTQFTVGGLAQRVGAAFRGIGTRITGLINSIKRVAFYRLIRSLMRMITQGFQEGLKNLYAYSMAVGTQFAGSMDRLATSALYLKNSLAAMAAPLINALAPAIDFIADKLVNLFNLIAQFISRLSGKATYTAAKKVATTWQGAAENATGGAKKAVDEFRRYVLGFDELNILGSNNDSGGSGGGGGGAGGLSGEDMFEEREIEGSVAKFADRLREAFQNHDWEGLGQVLGEGFNIAVDNIPWAEAGEKVGFAINAIFTTADSFFREADFVRLGESVAEFINSGMAQVDFTKVGGTIAGAVTSGVDTVGGLLGGLNWYGVGKAVTDTLSGFFQTTTDWMNEKDWVTVGEDIVNSAEGFFQGGDWGKLSSSLSETIGTGIRSALQTAGGAIHEIFSGWIERIEKFVQTETDKGRTNVGDVLIDWFTGGLRDFADWLNDNIYSPFGRGLTGNQNFDFREWAHSIFGTFETSDPKWYSDEVHRSAGGYYVADLTEKLNVDVSLGKDGWTTLDDFVGDIHQKPFALGKSGWTTIDNYVGNISQRNFALGKSGWTTLDNYVGNISQRNFQLGKTGWSTIDKYVGNIGTKSFALGKNGWSTLDKYVGTISAKPLSLYKSGWNSLYDYTGTKVDVGVQLYKSGWTDFKSFIGLKNGGIVTQNGAVKFFRSGGWVQGAKAGAFPAYAGGAVNAGSVFVAGEAGPELVAHVNNRSEVLNASQIAQTMYHSTVAGMRAIAGDIASAVSSQINTGTNSQPIVCEVYLDRDKIATAVTRGQQAQNRRYSSTAM